MSEGSPGKEINPTERRLGEAQGGYMGAAAAGRVCMVAVSRGVAVPGSGCGCSGREEMPRAAPATLCVVPTGKENGSSPGNNSIVPLRRHSTGTSPI